MNSKMKDHFTFAAGACILHTCFFSPVAPSRQFTPVYVCSRTPNQPECVIKFNQPYAISSMRFVVMYKMVYTMLHSSEGFLVLYPTASTTIRVQDFRSFILALLLDPAMYWLTIIVQY